MKVKIQKTDLLTIVRKAAYENGRYRTRTCDFLRVKQAL